MNNSEVKSILVSRTVWGLVAAAVGATVPKYGELAQAAIDPVVSLISAGLEYGGLLFALFGRVKATKKVTITGK